MKLNIYDALLSRLSQNIIPSVVEKVAQSLIAESNGNVIGASPRRGRAAAARRKNGNKDLESLTVQRVQSNSEEFTGMVENLVREILPKIIEETFSSKMLPNHLTRATIYVPNDVVSGSSSGEYLRASNPLARDFFHPEFEAFCEKFFDKSASGRLSRKAWEWAFIYHRLNRSGALSPGRRGLGFGCGREKLPAIFASMGAQITATDAPFEGNGWNEVGAACGSAEDLYFSDVITRESFDRLVRYESCDMNNISESLADYDFCWSSCALEHLGSLQNGIDFIINSVEKTLKVGGIACHTTELNMSSDLETLETASCVLYRRQDLERLSAILEERGHRVEPLRIEPGDLPPDYLVDVPPYVHNPHLKLMFASYVTTSVGIVARRGR